MPQRRGVITLVTAPGDGEITVAPVAKGNLCREHAGFNLHAATKVAANDEQGGLALCKYILRPPLANDRLKLIDENLVTLQFKKPWSDGTSAVELSPLALIARLAAIVVPAGPGAYPPNPCPMRLRRTRRRPPIGI